jgi:hypothetical protein
MKTQTQQSQEIEEDKIIESLIEHKETSKMVSAGTGEEGDSFLDDESISEPKHINRN